VNNFSSGDVTKQSENSGFFGRPFIKPSFQILILPLKPRGIERPEGRDKACSIVTRSKSPCYVLEGPCALGSWRMRQKVRLPSNRNSRNRGLYSLHFLELNPHRQPQPRLLIPLFALRLHPALKLRFPKSVSNFKQSAIVVGNSTFSPCRSFISSRVRGLVEISRIQRIWQRRDHFLLIGLESQESINCAPALRQAAVHTIGELARSLLMSWVS